MYSLVLNNLYKAHCRPMFADLFSAEDIEMVVDVRDEEMSDAPPLVTPTDPYRWNFVAQSSWNAALRAGDITQLTTRAHSRARPDSDVEDLQSISALAANRFETPATPPYVKYTIFPADIPPELWLEESNRIRDWSGITPPSTQIKRRTHSHFDQPMLLEPRMRKPKRKNGAVRSRYMYQNGPRLTLNAPAPQISAEEEENIRKLRLQECESYLQYRHRRSKPHGRSTKGSPFGCPTPSESSSSSELSSSSSSSSSSYSSYTCASHSLGLGSESSYEEESNSHDSDVDDAVSATSEDSDVSSASWASYSSSSDSYDRRLSSPPGRHERLMRMHDHQHCRNSHSGLWQRLKSVNRVIPGLGRKFWISRRDPVTKTRRTNTANLTLFKVCQPQLPQDLRDVPTDLCYTPIVLMKGPSSILLPSLLSLMPEVQQPRIPNHSQLIPKFLNCSHCFESVSGHWQSKKKALSKIIEIDIALSTGLLHRHTPGIRGARVKVERSSALLSPPNYIYRASWFTPGNCLPPSNPESSFLSFHPPCSPRYGTQPVKDDKYFFDDGDCLFLVEGILFKVLSSYKGSIWSQDMVVLDPIPLSDDSSAEEFRALCWAVYALPNEIHGETTRGATDVKRLLDVAKMCHKYSLPAFESWALERIRIECRSPVDHLARCTQEMLGQIMGLASLCRNDKLLALVEGAWILRLQSRGSPHAGESLPTTDCSAALLAGEIYNRRDLQGAAYYELHKEISTGSSTLSRTRGRFSHLKLTDQQLLRLLEGRVLLTSFWVTRAPRETGVYFALCKHSCKDLWSRSPMHSKLESSDMLEHLKSFRDSNSDKRSSHPCAMARLDHLIDICTSWLTEYFLGR
ncbi:hypothetical protein C8F04DRAFT_1240367 [Mycena alexandri]|uniref:BTB/POZ domain-containing protein n=1 Tax=Mycena alexandri TaxID=1745969 RepID=A0AAD6SAC9_9AGAR|nr:hypothetical protein C8F04DRAFT_1240367 [Mycena alexandri]